MGLVDIIKKVESEGKAAVKKLQTDFDKRKKELEKEADEMHKQLEKDMKALTESDSTKVRERANIEAELTAKNGLLEAKRSLIDSTLDEAVKKLASSEDYEQLLADMLKKVEFTSGEIVPAKGKEAETKAAIQKSGKDFKLADGHADISGGFILRTEKIEIDNSFETIINSELKPTLEIELHKLLFA